MARSATSEETRFGIEPAQEIDIALTGTAYNRMRSFLTELGYLGTERILLKIGMVIFADDSSWYGDDFTRHPQSPSNWIRMEAPLSATSPRSVNESPALVSRSNFAPQATRSEKFPKGNLFVPAVSSPDFSSFPQLESLLVRTTYVPTPQSSQCYKKDPPGIKICSFTMSCHAQRDRTDMTAGGFRFITGQASCTNSLGDHCGTISTSIAIPCSFGGGGGGGGGGLEDFNNTESCYDDAECDFGYFCDWSSNTCSEL